MIAHSVSSEVEAGSRIVHDEGAPVGPAIVNTANVTACTITGNAVSIFATHVSNPAGCAVAGNN